MTEPLTRVDVAKVVQELRSVSLEDWQRILAHDAAQRAQLEEGYGSLSRLFNAVAPQCEPLDTVAGVATQIDNYMTGLRARVRELEQQWHLAATHDADMDYVQTISALTQAHQQAVTELESYKSAIRLNNMTADAPYLERHLKEIVDTLGSSGAEVVPRDIRALQAQLQQAVEALVVSQQSAAHLRKKLAAHEVEA